MINSGFKRIIVITSICLIPEQIICISAQDTTNIVKSLDTLSAAHNDSINQDTSKVKTKHAKSEIDAPVKYSSKDSLFFDLNKRKVFLYGDADVTYQNIELKAAYIEFNMGEETVYARGAPDSTGNVVGTPVFKEGSEEFEAHWLRYNFKTKKGFIQFVKTKQENGILIGDSTKREPNGNINLKGGKYSTCELEHPHFYIGLIKAKSVPGDKIVSGPAYLAVADIPLPLIIPFGFFPNTKGISSGLLPPQWGEERTRGFYLEGGGYYFAFNDYMDLTLRGSIYSNGSWGTSDHLNYKKRYRYGGSLDFNYRVNITSEVGLPLYSVYKDYSISWHHSQDSKASPNSSFSASVNMSSGGYDRRNSYDPNTYLTNTKSSSISYTHNWPNSPFHLSANLNHNQNSETHAVDMTLPDMSFTMDNIYPLRSKENVGEPKWYDDFQINYNAHFTNKVHTNDSTLFTSKAFTDLDNGFSHTLLPSISFKLNSFINLTPSISYNGVLFSRYVKYKSTPNLKDSTYSVDSLNAVHHKLWYAQSINPSISLGASPKFYGMYIFKNSRIKAIRHVMSPSASISFTPDITKFLQSYYDTVRYGFAKDQVRQYSYFANTQSFSAPYPPGGKSASINMALRNNFEMKYLSVNDTSSEEKKLPLLENLDFSASYNLIADSFKLSNISMSAGTRLFQDKFNIQFSANFDPYALDSFGRRINSYELTSRGKLARLTSSSLSLSTSFKSAEGGNKDKTAGATQNRSNVQGPYSNSNDQVDFSIPWSLSLQYNFGYQLGSNLKTITSIKGKDTLIYKKYLYKSVYNMGVTFSGDLSITKKWKVGFNSGYDFTNRQITLTSVNISRDLHCWQMTFNWIPFGFMSRYTFTISAVAPILRDLKYTKQSDFRKSFQ